MSLWEDYREVAQRLNERIEWLAPELLPNGCRQGRRWWRVGSLSGEPGRSLVVEVGGAKRGKWRDYASGDGGDALDLVAGVRFGGDKRQAFEWGRDWLHLPAQRRSPSAATSRRREVVQNDNYVDLIRRSWLEARPLVRGDPVDRYLSGRAIELAELGRAPRALRYHPRLWNSESRRHWPAMVAAITSPDGRMMTAIHRTWLEETFDVAKAPLAHPKLTLGSYAGGSIKVWRGAAGKAWHEMPAGETVVVGEGIEDTLSVLLRSPQHRAICAVSLSAMLVLQLPAAVAQVIMIGQNDRRDSAAMALRDRVIARWRADGRYVQLLVPPVWVKDLNELSQWKRAKA